MGRRKIEMEMVKDAGSRQVTFSKRRNGLFKKANELAILCGAELAIVVFSPGGKPYSFGHPSVDAVAHRFLHHHNPPEDSSKVDSGRLEKLNKRLVNLTKQIEVEKEKGAVLDKAHDEKKLACGLGLGPGYGPGPENLDELEILKRSLEELKDDVKLRMREMEAASSLLLLAEN